MPAKKEANDHTIAIVAPSVNSNKSPSLSVTVLLQEQLGFVKLGWRLSGKQYQ